jgi:hypothetical protein
MLGNPSYNPSNQLPSNGGPDYDSLNQLPSNGGPDSSDDGMYCVPEYDGNSFSEGGGGGGRISSLY